MTPLKLAELWSVCGMLRLGLIEFLWRVAMRVAPPEPDRELVHTAGEHDVCQEAADERSMKHGILGLRDLAMLDWKEFWNARVWWNPSWVKIRRVFTRG